MKAEIVELNSRLARIMRDAAALEVKASVASRDADIRLEQAELMSRVRIEQILREVSLAKEGAAARHAEELRAVRSASDRAVSANAASSKKEIALLTQQIAKERETALTLESMRVSSEARASEVRQAEMIAMQAQFAELRSQLLSADMRLREKDSIVSTSSS